MVADTTSADSQQTAPTSVSRRQFFSKTVAAAAVAGLATAVPVSVAHAKAPFANVQAPYFYRFKIGAIEATVVSDGPFSLGDPAATLRGASKEEVSKILSDHFIGTEKLMVEQNVLIINTGDKIVMFDTGLGNFQFFGTTSGRLLNSMAAAGIRPQDVDAVCLTHAHVDHAGGLVGEDGKPVFPNATIYINEAEYDFYTDEAKLPNAPAGLKRQIERALKNLKPLRERIVFVKDGQEIVPGVRALATVGHSVGHMLYMIASGNQTLAVMGDLLHHSVLVMENIQKIEFKPDWDAKLATQTRIRFLDQFAANRTAVLGYHFPWPGIGHVVKTAEGFHYIPTAMNLSAVG